MSEEEIDDPHVERLIQAVAFLNARTRRKIDDDFPEISQALLQVLYPHYLAPFPSATIVRFALPPDQAELVQGFSIARGSSLETEPIDGEPYRFRTCYPVTVWPIELTKAGVQQVVLPASADTLEGAGSRGHQAGARVLRQKGTYRRIGLRDSCASSSMRRRRLPTSCMRPSSTTRWECVVSGDADEARATDPRSRLHTPRGIRAR